MAISVNAVPMQPVREQSVAVRLALQVRSTAGPLQPLMVHASRRSTALSVPTMPSSSHALTWHLHT